MDQNDFRRIISDTSRSAVNNEVKEDRPAESSTEAAKPKKDKSRFFKPRTQAKQKDAEAADPTFGGKYRDRAAERRVVGGQQDAEQMQLQNIDYAHSKYLGGDLAHTHLVKGLDYALLQKMRSETASAASEPTGAVASTEAEQNVASSAQTVATTRGAAIVAAVQALCKAQQPIQSRHKFSTAEISRALSGRPLNGNEAFLPGRMVYQFELDPNAEADPPPSLVVHSALDVLAPEPSYINPKPTHDLLEALEYLALGKQRRHLSQSQSTHAKKPEVVPVGLSKTSAAALPEDDDEDIFAGVGRYAPETTFSSKAIDSAAVKAFHEIPHNIGALGRLSAASESEAPAETSIARVHAGPVAPTLVAPSGDSDGEEDDSLALQRSKGARLSAVVDLDEELQGAPAVRDVAYKTAELARFAGVAASTSTSTAQKRPRPKGPEPEAPPATRSKFDALGGDIGPVAVPSTARPGGTDLNAYERRSKTGSWLSTLTKGDDKHKDREKKRSKLESEFSQIQKLMDDRRSGQIKGAVAGFGGGANS